ncbi:MAG: hypothetical protein KGS61_15935, partial [Verrucomicrobia bacterium]|nr:hypothetical protein [Verrucomicrobiota bacterium]
AQGNFPMALDEGHRRLLIGSRNPPRLIALDAGSGKVVAEVPIGNDTDDLFYDAKRQRVYVSCGGGVMDVIQQRDADHYLRLASLPTAPGARTSLFVPALDRLYLAVPRRGDQQAEIRVFQPAPARRTEPALN